MLDAARESETETTPNLSPIPLRIKPWQRCIALTLSALFAVEARADETPTTDSAVTAHIDEPVSTHEINLRSWITSEDGIHMKHTLKAAVSALDDPSFAVRQRAMATVMTSMDELQEIIYPFPEELRQILGEGLFPSDRYGEDFRQYLRESYNYTSRQAHDADAIQEALREKMCDRAPHIMAGDYSPQELLAALEKQTGLRIRLAHSTPAIGMTVCDGRNEWAHVIQDWCRTLGGWTADYDFFDRTMYIQEHHSPNRIIFFRGSDFFVHETFSSHSTNTTAIRTPTVGEFFEAPTSLGNAEHRFFTEGIRILGPNEKLVCWPQQSRQINTDSIPTLTSSKRLQQTVKVGGDAAVLGKYQSMHTYVRENESEWIITIDIQFLGDTLRIHADTNTDVMSNIILKNEYEFLDGDNEVIEVTFDRDNDVIGGYYCEFAAASKPAYVRVKYIPDLHHYNLRFPRTCLPNSKNP